MEPVTIALRCEDGSTALIRPVHAPCRMFAAQLGYTATGEALVRLGAELEVKDKVRFVRHGTRDHCAAL